MKVQFKVPGKPQGKGRPRFSRRGKYVTTYTPERTREYEKLVLSCWKFQSGETFPRGTPMSMTIKAHFTVPKSASKKKRAELLGKPYTGKPDTDNIGKSIADAVSGTVFYDDAQIVSMSITKDYAEEACVEVLIEEAENITPAGELVGEESII